MLRGRPTRTAQWAVIGAALVTAGLLAPGSQTAGAATAADGDVLRGPAAPAEYSYLQKKIPGEPLPRHAYESAASEAAELPRTSGRWKPLGPTNIGGRIVDLALDPQDADTVYAAAASGGLWRSTNAGRTFSPAWPARQTQAMGAVATSSDGTLYAGTGEPNPGGGSLTYEGTGVYRSTDDGKTWKSAGLRDSGTVGALRADPRDPRRIFAAAAGSLYVPGGDRGVYLSENAGKSWRHVLDVPNEFTGAVDVQIDPADPDRVYAVMWDRRREPDKRTYGGTGSGVFRSDDGGSTWRRLGGGLPASGPDTGRIGLGVAASEPGRLYALVGDAKGGFAGFFTSADAGDSWTRLPDDSKLAQSQGGFSWWFGKVWVDPDDARHVHAAGVALMTSKDGGASWTGESQAVHVDQHAMVWDPRRPSRVYLGNDGGVYRSEADGDRGWTKATYMPWTQLYSVATTPQDTGRISGGAQDNGSLRSWGGAAFNEYLGGDGLQNLINPADRENVYACYQYGNCARSTDGGNAMTYFTQATTSDRRNWFTPLQFDPVNPRVMYYGGNRLNRSTDGGATWQPISPDLTGGPSRDNYPYGTLTTVAAARDGRTVWAGTDDGRVWVTRDLGANWTKVLEGQPWVTRVVVDPKDPETAYVALSGYRSGEAQPHLLRTTDAGASWTDLSGNLPQAPVNDVVLAGGGRLYAATDQGVFIRNGSRGWRRLGGGMPLVPVDDLDYDARNHRLVAATFGRGFYEFRTP
ncbi:glycosyl hydrolase [Streptomyces sp. ISL-99]|uniref:WD40/YVTN/BNR-like repeat-containing protein n=1 Tax=Streptomyces sp. ISL-99 TaxID=2819193 RepID=UPI001BEBB001|nr:sialidase family protein [Streptomyces sp. ISL-99]MBT2526014.1 glycosyl hydrolase [Streptomyces sp. ISL-99]